MIVSNDVLQEIRTHAEETYPEECCGFLLGQDLDGGNYVTALHRAENQREENRQRRFLMTPSAYLAASRAADAQGLDVVGFYHSHPDHPARPSSTDLQEATFPGFTYVIVSVQQGRSSELTAWCLATDRSQFLKEEVTTAMAAKPAQPGVQ